MTYWNEVDNQDCVDKKIINNSPAPPPAEVKSINNRVYFYSGVTDASVLKFQESLDAAASRSISYANLNSSAPVPIYIHINSCGGSLFAGFAAMDIIERCPIMTVSIVEGRAASAATLMSLAAKKRLITPHSHMLIHQLSSVVWGTYEEINDHKQNVDSHMNMIRNIYLEKTKINKKILNELLKHDLYFDASQCIKLGLIDEIYAR